MDHERRLLRSEHLLDNCLKILFCLLLFFENIVLFVTAQSRSVILYILHTDINDYIMTT